MRVCLFYIQQPTNMSVTMHGAPSGTPTPKKQPAHCAGLFFSREVSSGARLSLAKASPDSLLRFYRLSLAFVCQPVGLRLAPLTRGSSCPPNRLSLKAQFVKGKPLRGDFVTLDKLPLSCGAFGSPCRSPCGASPPRSAPAGGRSFRFAPLAFGAFGASGRLWWLR